MYRLSKSLPYLLNRVGVRMGELFSRRIAQYGVTLPMYRVLASLWETGDQRLSDLSAATSVEISTLSRMVGTMKRMGLVTRARPEDNGRTVRINLTPRGRQLAEELIPHAELFETVGVGDLAPADVAALKAMLIRVYEHLNQIDPEVGLRPDANGRASEDGHAEHPLD